MWNSDLFWADFSHFGPVLTILEVFLTELEKKDEIKKLHMTLEDVTNRFYFMTFIPKSHILANKLDFSPFLHVLAILKVFLTEKEKK